MKRLLILIIALLGIQNSYAQWSPGSFGSPMPMRMTYGFNSGFSAGFSSFNSIPRPLTAEQLKRFKRFKREYKHAFSGDVSLGLTEFHGDLLGQQTDLPNQVNINIAVNKRKSPRYSWKMIMSLGNYQDIGTNSNPNLHTSNLATEYNSSDFYNSILTGSYTSFSLMARTKLGFSKLDGIDEEKKFGVFLSWGIGYMTSNVLLRNRFDENIRISRHIKDLVVPIMIEASYLIKEKVGLMISYDYYFMTQDHMDLMNSDQSAVDYFTNIRTGLFFKIDN